MRCGIGAFDHLRHTGCVFAFQVLDCSGAGLIVEAYQHFAAQREAEYEVRSCLLWLALLLSFALPVLHSLSLA